ncbi:tRNA(Met) cytidine acetate ligase [Lachnospira pectinoschiza]|uniref:tRNA(Met) cytidine acetate ligase n=1 Tax=Lachnospira pectinoschiza TaxID=28052 RepID=A0A1G9VL76_9FIRM|nr:nucleotidyltransferase family protein [Lachnospira pectinoschiza]SDM72992.1 Predicted nucleotidyltransferase [Lachnospira pectinoschiza]
MTIGIVAEFNPFHNGHKYLLDSIKAKYPESTIVVAMSGDYVQRGEGAIIDKYKRTSMALSENVNLILQIATKFSLSSASYFAFASINSLIKLGANKIIFGMESDNIENLVKIAKLLNDESPEFSESIKTFINEGYSYPKARMLALSSIYGEDLAKETTKSNNVLAIEYIRQILKYNKKHKANISFEGIKRLGQDFNDEEIKENLTSATAIRNSLYKKDIEIIKGHTNEFTYNILEDSFNKNELIFINDFSDLLYFKLLDLCKYNKDEAIKALVEFNDLSEFLAASIYTKFISWGESKKEDNSTFSFKICDFIDALKSKTYTYSRISRCLFCIILGIKKTDVKEELSFIKVLGFDKKGQALLSSVKKNLDIELITKNSKGKENKEFLEEMYMSDLYNNVLGRKAGKIPEREIKKAIVKEK